MQVEEQKVRDIVAKLVGEFMSAEGEEAAAGTGIFSEMDELIGAAKKAHLELKGMSLEKRKEIIRSIREVMLENLDTLCSMAVEETTFGNCRDKEMKNRLAIMKTPGVEDLEPTSYTDDYGLTLVERSPYGVIGLSLIHI